MAKHLDNQKDVFYWQCEGTENPTYYDYAIVENNQDIALVRIIGYGYLNDDEKLASKKVLKLITSADWEANYENQ